MCGNWQLKILYSLNPDIFKTYLKKCSYFLGNNELFVNRSKTIMFGGKNSLPEVIKDFSNLQNSLKYDANATLQILR